MGADFDDLTLDGKLTVSEVRKRFKDYQDECSHESGNSYSGRLNMCPDLTIENKEFNSQSEAYDYLNETCKKWENAIAVKYLVSAPLDKTDSKWDKLGKDLETLQNSLYELEREFSASVETKLKSVEFIKCSHCKSKLDTRFRVKTLKCPVCDSSFLSKSDLKKRETLKTKVETAKARLKEYHAKMQAKANASKNRVTRWLIGGVCSS